MNITNIIIKSNKTKISPVKRMGQQTKNKEIQNIKKDIKTIMNSIQQLNYSNSITQFTTL